MSYKHKDEIIMNIKDYNAGRKVTGGTHAFESKLEEIHNVYAQAPKADEYEAKARAFDAYHSIISKHIEQQYSHNKHDMVKRFVKIHGEYESGERSE